MLAGHVNKFASCEKWWKWLNLYKKKGYVRV